MSNPFRAKKGPVRDNKKATEWGKVKFNPLGNAADRVEAATPWRVFKKDIIEKQNEELHQAKAVDMNTAEAQKWVKEREQKHRKAMMEAKRKEPTQWDDFGEQSATEKPPVDGRKQFINEFTDLVKKNVKADGKMDNRKLNFNQNNLMKQIITKNCDLASNSTLRGMVEHMKYEKEKKKNKKHLKNDKKLNKVKKH